MIAAQVFSNMVAAFVPLPGGSGGAEVSFSAFCHVFFQNLLTPALLVWRLLTYYGCIVFGCIFVSIGARKYVGAPRRRITAIRMEKRLKRKNRHNSVMIIC